MFDLVGGRACGYRDGYCLHFYVTFSTYAKKGSNFRSDKGAADVVFRQLSKESVNGAHLRIQRFAVVEILCVLFFPTRLPSIDLFSLHALLFCFQSTNSDLVPRRLRTIEGPPGF